jgi:hypothetical protein
MDKDTPMAIDGETPPAKVKAQINGEWVVIGEGVLEHKDDGVYITVNVSDEDANKLMRLKDIPEVGLGVYKINKENNA